MRSFQFMLLSLFIVLFTSFCGNTNYKKTNSGVEYKILKNGKGKKVQEGDFLTLHVIRYMADSLIFDSHKSQPDVVQYQKSPNPQQKYNLLDVLALVSVGDSVALRVPLDSIFKDVPNKPSFYKKGAYAKIFLTVIDAKNQAQQAKETEAKKSELVKSLIEKAKADKPAIEEFVAKNKLTGSFNQQGVFVITTKEGSGAIIAADTTISVIYTGKLLNGTTFDSNVDRVKKDKNAFLTFKAGLGQLIPGFDYSLLGLKKGSHVRFIIPSALAYGEQGAGDKIPPHSILDFYVEIQNR